MPREELPDPTTLAEKQLFPIEIGHHRSLTPPVDRNFARGSGCAVRAADRVGRKLVKKAPQIEVVVVSESARPGTLILPLA
jgi:hypothetical protein